MRKGRERLRLLPAFAVVSFMVSPVIEYKVRFLHGMRLTDSHRHTYTASLRIPKLLANTTTLIFV